MEDIFEQDRDEVRFRYPLYERLLWLFALAALVVAFFWRQEIAALIQRDRIRGMAAIAVIGFLLLVCFWISFRAWQSKVIVSPTTIKAWYLFQGVERISWEHMARVVYKWRPLGHILIFVGTDGSKVRFRSSLSGYDRVIRVIRENAPEPILDQLDDLIGEEDEEPEPEADEPRLQKTPPEPVHEEERTIEEALKKREKGRKKALEPTEPNGPPDEGA